VQLDPEPPNRQLPTKPNEAPQDANSSATVPCVGTNLMEAVVRLVQEAADVRQRDPFRHACAYADSTIAARILNSLYSLFAIGVHAKGNGAVLPTGLEEGRPALSSAAGGADTTSSNLVLLVRTIRSVSNSLYSALDHSDTNPQFEILWSLLTALMALRSCRRRCMACERY
jgi:hypothetical protein